MGPMEYHDDPSIADTERLFRRIHLKHIVPDGDTGLARLSSAAFRDKDLSVDIEAVLLENGQAISSCLQGQVACKLAFITAGHARQLQQVIFRDPTPNNPSHGIVYGSKSSKKVVEGLRDSAQWVIPSEAPRYAEIEAEKLALGMMP